MSTAALAPPPRPDPPPISSGSHVPALDTLRGVAILAVMLYHFNRMPSDGGAISRALGGAFRLGGSGVDLFFVLSGFLITGILCDSKGGPHYYRNFFVRRSLRIFPLYYGVLVLGFVALPMLGVVIDPVAFANQGWLWIYGTNVAQARANAYLFGGFDHFWSLAVEEHFYLVWPVVIALCSRRGAIGACLVCILAATGARALMAAQGNAIGAYVLTPCRLDSLAVGALIALVARGPGGMAWLGRYAGPSALLSGVLLAMLSGAMLGQDRMSGAGLVARFSLSAWFFGSVLVLAVDARAGSRAGRAWGWAPLRGLGTYSYGLYVFHVPLMNMLDRVMPAGLVDLHLGPLPVGAMASMAVVFSASLAVAVASWHLFERHVLAWKDRLAPRESAAGAASAASGPHRRPEGARAAFDSD